MTQTTMDADTKRRMEERGYGLGSDAEDDAIAAEHLGINLGSNSWPGIIPLNVAPPVPLFPKVLPEPLEKLAQELTVAMNCPQDWPRFIMLVQAGAAIGNARRLAIKASWDEPAIFYACLVGPPGSVKSPILKILRRPFVEHDRRWRTAWDKEMENWHKLPIDQRGSRPILKRCLVADTTVETLLITLQQNPRGLLLQRDELSAWLASMNQYKGGKGSDRQTYLELWGGERACNDRKSEKSREGAPLVVDEPFLGILGGMQPDVLSDMRGESRRGKPPPDTGWTDRFLWSYPEQPKAVGEKWIEVGNDSLKVWGNVVSTLLALPMVKTEDGVRPFFVKWTDMAAKKAWEDFTNRHAAEENDPHLPPRLRGPWSKMKAYAARCALVIQHLRWACGEVKNAQHVDAESMRRAEDLVTYFKSHTKKVLSVMGADPRIGDARRVVRWIHENRLKKLQKRTVQQAFKGSISTVEELDGILRILEHHHYIRVIPTERRDGPGRPSGPWFEVNPAVHTMGCQYPQNETPEPPEGNFGNIGDIGAKEIQPQEPLDPSDPGTETEVEVRL